MQIDDLLITEQQLSTRLNQSVHADRRGEFSLLLAMLSQDALDFSQFHLPKSEIEDNTTQEAQLREQLGAGPKQPLAPSEFNMLIGQFNAQRLSLIGENKGMADIKLNQCLNPEPFSIRDDVNHIPLPIIDNCELAVRRRLQKDEIEIDNPRFSEKGLDNRLYEIKALRGVQKENNLELYIVEGKLRTDTGTWIYLNAKKGNFNQIENLIELDGEITFYTDEDEEFYSDYASFSINNNLIVFDNNIKHIKGSNTITSDKSMMKDNFNHIIYEGNVSMLYVIN